MQARIGQNRQNQLFVTHTCRARRHRHQRVIGHARSGIHFQQKRLLVAVTNQHFPASPARTTQCAVCLYKHVLNALRQSIRQLCRTHVLRIVRQIFVFKIVVAIRRFDLHQWQGMRAAARTQYRAGHFASLNALLNQSVRIVAPCQFTRGLQLIGSSDFARADGGAFEWRFDKQRQTQLRHNRVRVHLFATRKHHVFRRLQTVLQPNLLGAYLVHRQAAG